MKNLILISGFILSCLIANGQCRVGYSFKEIFEEYSGKCKVERIKIEQDSALKIIFPNSMAYYVFNKNQQCYVTFIKPTSIEKLDMLLKMYDKEYKCIVPFIWIAKVGEGEIKIEMKNFEDLGLCFMFSPLSL
ncbi:MAG TPA: hypothetical protein VIH57_00175 [Bacteroidales bacterium]